MNALLIPLLSTLGPAAVLLLMAVAFAETGVLLGFFLPGDSLLFAAGVLVATEVLGLPLWLVGLLVATAAAAGDQVGYLVGRRFGPAVFRRPGARFLRPEHVERAHAFFERHGRKTVVLARFVPMARTLTPVLAGTGRLDRRVFTAYNLLGASAWTAVLLTAGYFLGGVPFVAHHVELLTVGLVAVSLAPAALALLRRGLRARHHAPVAGRPAEPVTRLTPLP